MEYTQQDLYFWAYHCENHNHWEWDNLCSRFFIAGIGDEFKKDILMVEDLIKSELNIKIDPVPDAETIS